MPTFTTPQEIAAAIEEALDLGGHLLIRFAHAQVRQLKSSEVELLVDTLKAAQPEGVTIPVALARSLANGPDSLAVWELRGALERLLPQPERE